MEKPIYTITEIAPNLIYFFKNDGLTIVIENLLYPITSLLKELGMAIELYFFSADTAWLKYEHLQGEVFDHVLAMLHTFGLQAFQSPTGLDIKDSAI